MDGKITKSLRQARRVVILTGAGVSAESGLPTFRDKQTGLQGPSGTVLPQLVAATWGVGRGDGKAVRG
jgi:hypothetical protein